MGYKNNQLRNRNNKRNRKKFQNRDNFGKQKYDSPKYKQLPPKNTTSTPTTTTPRKNNSSSHHGGLGSHVSGTVREKIIRDITLTALNGRDKPELNLKDYSEEMVHEIGYSAYHTGLIYSAARIGGSEVIIPVKVGLMTGEYGSCMYHEINYLNQNDINFKDNRDISRQVCSVRALGSAFNSELGMMGSMIGTTAFTGMEVMLERNYLQKPLEHNWFVNQLHIVDDVVSKYIDYNLYKGSDVIMRGPVDYVIHYGEKVIDTGINYFNNNSLGTIVNDYTFFSNPLSSVMYKDEYYQRLNEIYNPHQNKNKDPFHFGHDSFDNSNTYESYYDLNQDVFNYQPFNDSQMDYNFNINTLPNTDYCIQPEIEPEPEIEYEDNQELNTAMNTEIIPDVNTDIDLDDKNHSIEQKPIKSEFIVKVEKYLNAAELALNILNVVKNFKDEPGLILVEVERMFVNLKCDNCVFQAGFNIIADLIENGTFTFESFKGAFSTILTKALDFPMSNALNLIQTVLEGGKIDKLLFPVMIDILDLFIPGLGLVNTVLNIKSLIESFFSKQKVIKISGIDALYTDELKIGFFKIRHKITIENDFFDIHITRKTRHASDAKKYCKKEFERQLDYKVYQVIGIPIEFINDTIKKPETRLDSFKFGEYIHSLESNWMEVNEKYLTNTEKEVLTNFYFESPEEREHRYELLKQGLKESYAYEHRNDSIIQFCQEMFHEIKEIFERDIGTLSFSLESLMKLYNGIGNFFHDCFNELFCYRNTKKIKNPEEYEEKIRTKAWEHARDERKKLDQKVENNKFLRKLVHSKPGYVAKKFIKWFWGIDVDKINIEELESDNQKLKEFRDSERKDYENNEGQYSDEATLALSQMRLFERQKSVMYLVESAYSNFIGFMGSSIAYLDYELKSMYQSPVRYVRRKSKQFMYGLLQAHITRIIVDQAINTFSIMRCNQGISDSELLNYYNPAISAVIGLSIGLVRTILDTSKEMKGKKLKKMFGNTITSTANTSFGFIYSYTKDVGLISNPLDSVLWKNTVAVIIKGVKIGARITLSTNLVSAVLSAFLMNVGLRLAGDLYNKITAPGEIENNKKEIPKFLEIKKEVPLFQKVNEEIPHFEKLSEKEEPYYLKKDETEIPNYLIENQEIKKFETKKEISKFQDSEFKRASELNYDNYEGVEFGLGVHFDQEIHFDEKVSFDDEVLFDEVIEF